MINWKIDGSTGNLVIENGSVVRVQSDNAIAQNARATLHHLLTEWFLNTESGIDYFGQILVKNPDEAKITRLLKRAIRNALGVANIESFRLTRNGQTFSVSFSVITTNNERFTLQEEITI
mgnify:CR=1 FL=1|jgi:hypothetical protein